MLLSPHGSDSFTTTIPPRLLQLQRVWLERFTIHHDPAPPHVEASVVSARGAELGAALREWLQQPDWAPLQRALEQEPHLPLRLRCRPSESGLARLPWESLALQRPIWRLAAAVPPPARTNRLLARRPRLLLLVGAESGLHLEDEVTQLQRLQQQGGLELTLLRGASSCLTELSRQLREPLGWDGLVYLGHSEADPRTGGRLQLGDGRWLSGRELQQQLESAVAQGKQPALVLLNSCSGLDLADRCLAAGVPWVLCFRELVPSQAASLAFCSLIQELQKGQELSEAVSQLRRQLNEQGPAGCALLLSLIGADTAPPLQLPLSRWQQFKLRLARSNRAQAIAAGITIALGLVLDLNPWLPPGPDLLDHRLQAQRHWRQLTGNHGPKRQALPVLLLDDGPTAAALGVTPTPKRVPRAALVAVLKRVAPAAVPMVAMDVVLDEQAPHTAELAALIRQQQRPRVLAGWFSTPVAAKRQGERSIPLPELRASGLQWRDLVSGFPGKRVDGVWPLPLRLFASLGPESFAWSLAEAADSSKTLRPLPDDVVMDWSLDWSKLISNLKVEHLEQLRSPVLLLGADGSINEEEPDRFLAPQAIASSLEQWRLGSQNLPGPLLQAALAQSLAMGHWLTPPVLATTTTTALTAGLGVVLAAALSRRRQRLLLVLLLSAAAIPLNLELTTRYKLLFPLALPIVALASTTLIRHD
ncbi:MAG: CHAT domain-containing protein [Synechococcus sp.]